jgi:hypothetical protein
MESSSKIQVNPYKGAKMSSLGRLCCLATLWMIFGAGTLSARFSTAAFLPQQGDSVTKSSISVGTRANASYLGAIVYPGAKLGLEFPLRRVEILKPRPKGEHNVWRDRFLTADLGFYHHGGFHDNLFLLAAFNYRRTANNGIFAQFGVGLGVSKTFFGGTTYVVKDDGSIDVRPSSGHFYVVPHLNFAFGWDLSKKANAHPFSIWLKPSLMVLAPFAGGIFPVPTAELGFSYRLNQLLVHPIRLITKQRHP